MKFLIAGLLIMALAGCASTHHGAVRGVEFRNESDDTVHLTMACGDYTRSSNLSLMPRSSIEYFSTVRRGDTEHLAWVAFGTPESRELPFGPWGELDDADRRRFIYVFSGPREALRVQRLSAEAEASPWQPAK
jgi:hypothetical protein